MARSAFRIGQRVGKYKLRRRLGHGGSAEVFSALDTVEGISVALKIPEATRDAVEDCRQEIRILSRLCHPNVLSIKNADVVDGRLVIAFPLGVESFDERLTRRISLTRALDYGEQFLRGLAHAHSRKVLHRDVKPENMIIFEDGQLKLADFGAGRASARTRQGTSVGTIGYMAPEQALGRTSTRSDVFSAGLVLYRLTTGHLPDWPFDWPGPGRDRLRRLTPEWGDFLQRALAVQERRRFADAERMLTAFEKVVPAMLAKASRSAKKKKR